MRRRVGAALTVLALGFNLIATPGVSAADPDTERGYIIRNAKTFTDESIVRGSGARVDGFEHGKLYVTARPSQAARLRRLGFKIDDIGVLATRPVDPGYTDYTEMIAEVNRIVAAFPAIASKQVIGQSHESRDLVALKISDNVGTDESEPEVLYVANQHAREHLTVEMALRLANILTSEYASNTRVAKLVDTREIWILPMVNPDGVQYDMVGTANYKDWRKNRQPNTGSTFVGTDLNRNWAYKWGCCGGSSPHKSSITYRGPAPFSAPETKAISDWVLTRRVGGVQQIKMAIDIHTYSELVMWPFSYTFTHVTTGMNTDEYDTHATIGTELAGFNNYWPAHGSELYITDGGIEDWLWGDQRIFTYTFEMFPKDSDLDEFYPPASVIPAETNRNREAMLRLADWADCPFRAIGKEGARCPATNDYSLTLSAAAVTVAQGATVSVNLHATKTAGADQTITLNTADQPINSAVFMPATIQTDGVPHSIDINADATTPPGVYTVIMEGTGSSGTVRTARVQVTVTGNPACSGTNGTDVIIPDGTGASATSAITITGCTGNAGSVARLDLKVAHAYIGDLRIVLLSPAGHTFTIHDRNGGPVDNIDRAYPLLNLSAETANGDWKLQATDVSSGTSGKIDSWSLILK